MNTEFERQVFDELNRVRADPPGYVRHLRAYRASIDESQVPDDGAPEDLLAAVDEAIGVLAATRPRPRLALVDGLSEAARLHVAAQGPTGAIGHDGSAGDPRARIAKLGSTDGAYGENIAYGQSDAREVVIQLLVDYGVPGRGHRENILHAGFALVGVASGAHAAYDSMCAMIFAGHFVPWPARLINVAAGKRSTASSEYSPDHSARHANPLQPVGSGGWSPRGGALLSWWQVDLGKPYPLIKIELVTRQELDQPETRRSFEIWVSNAPDMERTSDDESIGVRDGAVVGIQGEDPLPHRATFTADATFAGEPMEYRYVRVIKTVAEYFFIGELRVFSLDPA
jgi:uncharacterized protein YkwD